MNNFYYNEQHQLMVENMEVSHITQEFGSPVYIYSKASLCSAWNTLNNLFKTKSHLVCYAVKANSNIAILNILAKLGSGFDIVSQGELERVLAAGGDPSKVVFSGVAKTAIEIERALDVGIKSFNVESVAELLAINHVAKKLNKKAPVALRINPDIDAQTHAYISTGLKEHKFGISLSEALETFLLTQQLTNIELVGIACHIGSQITEIQPFADAAKSLAKLVSQLKEHNIYLQHIDLGGGLGIAYPNEKVVSIQEYVQAINQPFADFPELEIIIEPGRAIVGNAGILVITVEYQKSNEDINFAIVDAGMNDIMRPALYDVYMDIIEVDKSEATEAQLYDVVGPICESSDTLGKQRLLALHQGDLLAILNAGAYCASMSSNYNSRPLIAEVLVDKEQAHLIRKREELTDLWRLETLLVD